MKKKKSILLTALAFLTVLPVAMASTIYIDDGATHTFNDNTYQDDYVFLDKNVINDPGTHANLVDGVQMNHMIAYNNSSITMTGGLVESHLESEDYGSITVENGTINGCLNLFENSTATMSGGSVGNWLQSKCKRRSKSVPSGGTKMYHPLTV